MNFVIIFWGFSQDFASIMRAIIIRSTPGTLIFNNRIFNIKFILFYKILELLSDDFFRNHPKSGILKISEHVRHTSGNVRRYLGGWLRASGGHQWFKNDSVLPNPMNVHDGFTRFTRCRLSLGLNTWKFMKLYKSESINGSDWRFDPIY